MKAVKQNDYSKYQNRAIDFIDQFLFTCYQTVILLNCKKNCNYSLLTKAKIFHVQLLSIEGTSAKP